MNKRVKTAWLKALRSGKYEQTKGRLHDNDGFCCLGVLCDIAYKNGHTKRSVVEAHGNARFYGSKQGESHQILPKDVMIWAGLNKPNPGVMYAGVMLHLSELNDHRELTFKQIANVIERNL